MADSYSKEKRREWNNNYHKKNKETIAQRKKQYFQDNKEKMYLLKKKRETASPEKTKAQRLIGILRRSGKIIPTPCEICGEIKVQGHHDDYNKPAELRWLCFSHHKEFHRNHTYDKTTYTYVKRT